jgi:hypothetical protein
MASAPSSNSPASQPAQPEPAINPQNLFSFLAEHDDYPVSGQRLAQEARQAQAGTDVVEFFEGIPVTLNNESEVVEHAVKPTEPPYGKTLDLTGRATETSPTEATLELSDIDPKLG